MKRLAFSFVGALWSIGAAAGASAHHSAAQFDFKNTVNLTGIVKEATFSNPHTRILLEVTDDERGTRDIEFEGRSRNNMHRQGFRPGMIKVGDKITIRIWPMRDGSDGGYITALITADGQAIGNIPPADWFR
jgi:hypothetical protein